MTDKPNTDIEKALKELAVTDFAMFLQVTGVDLEKVAICMKRMKGQSWQQIANQMKKSKGSVRNAAKGCTPCKSVLKK